MTEVRIRAALRTHRVKVGRFSTRALEVDGDGPTIVLLHGFSDSADGWREVMRELRTSHRRCVALDLPQHGRAERAGSGPFLPQLDEFVAGAVDRYGEDGVILVGNSIGGLAVLRAAHQACPALVGVVAIAPALSTPWLLRRTAIARPLLTRALTTTLPIELRGTATGPNLISAGFFRTVSPSGVTETAQAQYASHWGPGDLRRLLLLGGQTVAELRAVERLILDTPLQVPVTLVWGSRDRVCSPKYATKFSKAHPDVTTAILKDAGHCPQYERPSDIARLIIRARTTPPAADVGLSAVSIKEK